MGGADRAEEMEMTNVVASGATGGLMDGMGMTAILRDIDVAHLRRWGTHRRAWRALIPMSMETERNGFSSPYSLVTNSVEDVRNIVNHKSLGAI